METEYLITARGPNPDTGDDEVRLQAVWSELRVINLVRKMILAVQSMDETSADLRAIDFMNHVKPGTAQGLKNPKNGMTLVVQVHQEEVANEAQA